MPKYYCEYCDIYLTHSSPAGRRQHATGRKHINQKIEYFQNLIREPDFVPPQMIENHVVQRAVQAAGAAPVGGFGPPTSGFPRFGGGRGGGFPGRGGMRGGMEGGRGGRGGFPPMGMPMGPGGAGGPPGNRGPPMFGHPSQDMRGGSSLGNSNHFPRPGGPGVGGPSMGLGGGPGVQGGPGGPPRGLGPIGPGGMGLGFRGGPGGPDGPSGNHFSGRPGGFDGPRRGGMPGFDRGDRR
ncbi:U1 zinc finger protein [Besnoitia besnoiti]|uniref:U1 small nuclear ribonucleoprotein C n=1 Tax=Besnoitia besnoiti TaxID=94643 RepID=A0A2A9M9C8_BESBE|nr:U1 zinc finger protein [Besnoitia besnoiti]PFH32516.1 U1 zinc finger protein [Besnoitia besnoiti]